MGKVFTEDTCFRCKVVEIRPGATRSFPPEKWSIVSVIKQLQGEGWSNAERLIGDEPVCPSCADAIAAFAKMEPKKEKRKIS
ncbi:MAG: hypothetical protein HY471_00105 [Candidatus Sungbacteria bacterium]|nr:hypothetical protein [Candidatus Sungbacteria bacterium]